MSVVAATLDKLTLRKLKFCKVNIIFVGYPYNNYIKFVTHQQHQIQQGLPRTKCSFFYDDAFQ